MIFTFDRSVEGDWDHFEDEVAQGKPIFELMNKWLEIDLNEAGISFCIKKVREYNHHEFFLHRFEFVVDISHGDMDEVALIEFLQDRAYDTNGMSGRFHRGDFLFAEGRRLDIEGEGVFVLYLNNMYFMKYEQVEAVAWSERREDLEELLERERVAPYRDGDLQKNFRKGGPLELYNPPMHEAHGIKGRTHILPRHVGELLSDD